MFKAWRGKWGSPSAPKVRDAASCLSASSLRVCLPLCVCRLHFRFGIDAEGVGDAVDVVEIGDNFNGVQDVAVAQALLPQRIEVPCT